jgi:hypothetical protein
VRLASQTIRAPAGSSAVGRQVDRPFLSTLGILVHSRHFRHLDGQAFRRASELRGDSLQMHLAPPTGPAHAEVSSEIMKTSSSATC